MALELDCEVPRGTTKAVNQRPGITGGIYRKSCNFCISEADTRRAYLATGIGFLEEVKKMQK